MLAFLKGEHNYAADRQNLPVWWYTVGFVWSNFSLQSCMAKFSELSICSPVGWVEHIVTPSKRDKQQQWMQLPKCVEGLNLTNKHTLKSNGEDSSFPVLRFDSLRTVLEDHRLFCSGAIVGISVGLLS